MLPVAPPKIKADRPQNPMNIFSYFVANQINQSGNSHHPKEGKKYLVKQCDAKSHAIVLHKHK